MIVHLRLKDETLWAQLRAQAAMERVPVSELAERAFHLVLGSAPTHITAPRVVKAKMLRPPPAPVPLAIPELCQRCGCPKLVHVDGVGRCDRCLTACKGFVIRVRGGGK